MRVVGRQVLEELCQRHPDARRWIEHWLSYAESADWRTPSELKNSYAAASFLRDNVVIFNVKGNKYRLEATVAYRVGVIALNWAGTHSAYDARNKRRNRRR
jgi:mRNA interferase HigB